jgi:site-specific recombinase XerD
VDLEGGYLKVKGKGDKERIVAFGETAKSAFWGYLRIRKSTSDIVWLTEEMKPLTTQGWKSVMRRIVAQTGITKKCGTHTLRHTFAVNFLRAGGDIRMLQILLGHADIKMSQHYSKTLSSEDAVLFQKKYSFMDTVYKKGQ